MCHTWQIIEHRRIIDCSRIIVYCFDLSFYNFSVEERLTSNPNEIDVVGAALREISGDVPISHGQLIPSADLSDLSITDEDAPVYDQGKIYNKEERKNPPLSKHNEKHNWD